MSSLTDKKAKEIPERQKVQMIERLSDRKTKRQKKRERQKGHPNSNSHVVEDDI